MREDSNWQGSDCDVEVVANVRAEINVNQSRYGDVPASFFGLTLKFGSKSSFNTF